MKVNNKGLLWIKLFTVITIVLNLLMIFIVRNGNEEIFSNIFAIVITIAVFLIIKYAYSINKEKLAKVEHCGILFMFSVSLMRFMNRIGTVPVTVNYLSVIIFAGTMVFFLAIAVGGFIRIKNDKKK